MEQTEVTKESVIETALAKENITAQVIAKLKADYSGLTINGIDDKEGFKRVEEGRKECKAIRVLATKICKTGREEAIQIQKAWIAKEKEVVGQIEEIEKELEEQSDRIKKEKEEILFKAAQEAKLPMRKEKLASIGIEVEDIQLLKLDDLQFSQLFTEFYEKHLEEKAAELKKKEDEERERQAEISRKEKEEKLKIHNNRKEVLLPFWKFVPNEIIIQDLSIFTDEDFQDIFKNAFEAKEAFEEEQKELEVENKRLAEEKAKADALLKAEQEKAAKEKAEAEAKQKALEKELADKKEAEEKQKAEAEAKEQAELALGDKPKFDKMLDELEAIKTKYQFKAAKYKAVQNSVNELIDKTVVFAKSKL